MANSCDNYIRITGDKDQLKELYKDLVLDPESGCNSGSDIYANLRNKYQKELGNDARWFDMCVSFYNEEEIFIIADTIAAKERVKEQLKQIQ